MVGFDDGEYRLLTMPEGIPIQDDDLHIMDKLIERGVLEVIERYSDGGGRVATTRVGDVAILVEMAIRNGNPFTKR
jgi:hypothetical protein